MTITNNTDRTGQVTGSGSTGQVVNFNFKIFDSTDVKAYLTASGVVSEISTSDYVVAIDSSGTGGTVTFSGSYTISGSNTVQVVRVVPETQTLDLAASGPFPAESVEDALDRVVALTHQSLNDDGTGLVYDADSKRITGVSAATASSDAVNKTQLDALDARVASIEGGSAADAPAIPNPASQATNSGLLVNNTSGSNGVYVLKTSTEIADAIGMGPDDAVTHGQITTRTSGGGNGNLTAVGDVVLGTANSKDVTINDDLVLGVDGTIKPSSGSELGIHVDHDQAQGTLHIQNPAGASGTSVNADAKDLIIDSNAANVGMSIVQPDPDGATATQTSKIIFGVDNDNNRSGIHAIHQQAHGGGSAGNDDIMKFRVGAADFVELDKDAAGGTPKMAFDSATKITNVAEDTASSSAATVGQLESVAGQRTLVATFFGELLSTLISNTVSGLCKLVNNDGAGDSFEAFSPSGVAFASVTEASEKITLQPGTYRIHVDGGAADFDYNQTAAYGPCVCTAALGGTALAPTNVLLDNNGRAFIPRSGLVASTSTSAGSGSAVGGNLSDIGRAPVVGMVPFTRSGKPLAPVDGIVTLSTATDIFLYHILQRDGTQASIIDGSVWNMTITKLDGNV